MIGSMLEHKAHLISYKQLSTNLYSKILKMSLVDIKIKIKTKKSIEKVYMNLAVEKNKKKRIIYSTKFKLFQSQLMLTIKINLKAYIFACPLLISTHKRALNCVTLLKIYFYFFYFLSCIVCYKSNACFSLCLTASYRKAFPCSWTPSGILSFPF